MKRILILLICSLFLCSWTIADPNRVYVLGDSGCAYAIDLSDTPNTNRGWLYEFRDNPPGNLVVYPLTEVTSYAGSKIEDWEKGTSCVSSVKGWACVETAQPGIVIVQLSAADIFRIYPGGTGDGGCCTSIDGVVTAYTTFLNDLRAEGVKVVFVAHQLMALGGAYDGATDCTTDLSECQGKYNANYLYFIAELKKNFANDRNVSIQDPMTPSSVKFTLTEFSALYIGSDNIHLRSFIVAKKYLYNVLMKYILQGVTKGKTFG